MTPGPYEPFDEIRAGDLILLNGNVRKVRKVTRDDADRVLSIRLVKLRKSMYSQPYTVLMRSDMRSGQYRYGGIVGRQPRCVTPLECAMEAEQAVRFPADYTITQDDVVGVLR